MFPTMYIFSHELMENDDDFSEKTLVDTYVCETGQEDAEKYFADNYDTNDYSYSYTAPIN